MEYKEAAMLYNITKGLCNDAKKRIILVDCMNTIIKRNISLQGVLWRWAKQVGKEFNLYCRFLYKYRSDVTVGKMHNVVPIEEIYTELADQCIYFGILKSDSGTFCERAHKIEIECELRAQSVLTRTINFLKGQKKAGVKIYCVSDFRLPAQDLRRFFEQQNIEDIFDGIFSSCDAGVTKKTGELYPYVLEKLKVRPEDCMMLGDDLHSDCINASMYGIRGCWLHS